MMGTDAETTTCPHCGVAFSEVYQVRPLETDTDGEWAVAYAKCSACDRMVSYLVDGDVRQTSSRTYVQTERSRRLIHPRAASRRVALEVEDWYRDAYLKAALILNDAPEASAAVSRRCLQRLLVDRGHTTGSDLSKQIDSVTAAGIPGYLAEVLDRVRIIGNFAAHPIKQTHTGDVIEVEAGEAEANLVALDLLFDHYFVKPAQAAAQKASLNAKLAQAGRNPLP